MIMARQANIIREYENLPGIDTVHGVSHDGTSVWIAGGDRLHALDPESGKILRHLDVPAHAGTAFDGRHLFQIAENKIQKLDPQTGKVLATIPTPSPDGASGLAWAEGSLWVGQYRARQIHQVDPETGKVLRTIASNRFVTGVTWTDGQLWHGTWEDEQGALRRIDPANGAVLDQIDMPPGTAVTGLEADGKGRFYCGGGQSGKVRVVQA
jgi:glutamine cyclotransferase